VDAPFLKQLPLSETSLAQALREGGYDTWHVGKWHLGGPETWPERHGFDRNIGGCDWGLPRRGYFAPWGIPTLPEGPEGAYLTDRLTDEAVSLIRGAGDRPFFLNLWHYAVHVPITVAESGLVEKYRIKAKAMGLDTLPTFEEGDFFPCEHKKDKRTLRRLVQSDPNYAAMIENLDGNIGRLLSALDETGKSQDTLVVFTSDNGGLATAEGSPTCNAPLSEGKGWMYEGGVREPLIVRWPGRVAAGSECGMYLSSPDFYPTILEAAGLPERPEQHRDGMSFMPLLRGDSSFDRGAVFWHYPHYGNQGGTPGSSLRMGKFKLIRFHEDSRIELYDLESDPGEKENLAGLMPGTVLELAGRLEAWLADVHALLPRANPDYVPWRNCDSPEFMSATLPPESGRYDCDVYYGKDMGKFA
jgi:arylsulfatase A-like enzyme